MGFETQTFNPSGLPLPDDAPDTHPKVTELRALAEWAEGMVWTSPERHGAMSGQGDFEHNAALLVVDQRGRLVRIFDSAEQQLALDYARHLAGSGSP